MNQQQRVRKQTQPKKGKVLQGIPDPESYANTIEQFALLGELPTANLFWPLTKQQSPFGDEKNAQQFINTMRIDSKLPYQQQARVQQRKQKKQ